MQPRKPRRSLAILLTLFAALAVCGAAFAADVIGLASGIEGDTVESMAPEFAYSGLTRLGQISFAATRRANCIAAVQKASNALFDFIARRPLALR
jgi:hypothetical protein